MRPDLPTGTVTFLFTDIEGSTRLLHALGPDAYAEALAEHRRALRDAFVAHGGVEVDTQGDAFFVAFPTAVGAAHAARTGNDALEAGPIEVRMGLHTGVPTRTAEGYVGIDVHRGARVASLAHGRQIIASPATAALLDGEALRDLGTHRLKDFDGAIRLFQLGAEEFPPLRSPGSVELPTPPTRFIGRESELFDAVSLVYERDPRVLTIVGPGGTGKTRFAIELARLLADDADGATLFVPLAPVRDAALVLGAIGDRLGASSSEPAAIAGALRDRRTHVVVDNLEHLLPAAAEAIADVIEAAPTLRVLATSREPLRIQGEAELDLPPLLDDEAMTLFIERAHAVRPDVERSTSVGELCRRLDYLPLALELAAARTKLLTPDQLLDRLGQRLDLPGTRDADERHATLRATIAWSYDLLEPNEQRLFERLSVFAAGCTLESAESVCDADLDILGSLLDKSLVRRRTGRLGEERFWMLETIKEFAAERLADSGESEDVRRRHADRMLEIARSAHLSEDDDEPFNQAVALAERDDLRAALDWTAIADVVFGLELAVALENLWSAHAPSEGTRRIGDLLDRSIDVPPRLRASGLRARAGSAQQEGDFEIADPCYEESLGIFTELGDERGMATLWIRLASRAHARGDLDLARRLIEDCEVVSRNRFPAIEAQTSLFLGRFAIDAGDLTEAARFLHRSTEIASSLDWGWWEANALTLLLDVAVRRGDLREAERHGRTALTIYREQESRTWALYALAGLAQVALARNDLQRAGTLWGAASAEGERASWWQDWREHLARDLRGEARPEFVAAFERGRSFDLWDATAIALGEDDAQTEP